LFLPPLPTVLVLVLVLFGLSPDFDDPGPVPGERQPDARPLLQVRQGGRLAAERHPNVLRQIEGPLHGLAFLFHTQAERVLVAVHAFEDPLVLLAIVLLVLLAIVLVVLLAVVLLILLAVVLLVLVAVVLLIVLTVVFLVLLAVILLVLVAVVVLIGSWREDGRERGQGGEAGGRDLGLLSGPRRGAGQSHADGAEEAGSEEEGDEFQFGEQHVLQHSLGEMNDLRGQHPRRGGSGREQRRGTGGGGGQGGRHG